MGQTSQRWPSQLRGKKLGVSKVLEYKNGPRAKCLMAFCEQTNFNSVKKRICNCSFLRKVQRQEPVWMGTFMKKNKGHATRASLPPHLSCIMNFVNELLLVWYIWSHRKKLSNQTLKNFWENANLIFSMQKFGLFLQVLNLLFALVPYFWLFGLN